MSLLKIRKLQREFQPVAVGSDETKALFAVSRGERVLAASAMVLIPAAAASVITMALGDGVTPTGYLIAFDPEVAAGTLFPTTVAQTGTYQAANGKLYDVDDTVDVVYDQTTPGVVNPKVLFTIWVAREYPS